jgi:CheY-like chemotaxis protein
VSADIELFSPEQESKVCNGLNVLVVDDDKLMRTLISYILTQSGFKVITAIDGINAMQYYLKNKFDLVVTDLHMPKMDGYQLLNQIANLSKANNQRARVLVSSSDSTKPTILKVLGIARSANNLISLSFLVKPWTELDILTQTRNLFAENIQLTELDRQIDILNQEKQIHTQENRLVIGISETIDGIRIELGCDQKLSLDSATITEYLDNLENAVFCAPVEHFICCLGKMINQVPESMVTLLLLIRGLADKHGKKIQFIDASAVIIKEAKKQGVADILKFY